MTRPKLPQARYSVFIVLTVGIIVLFVSGYLGINLHDSILAAGLFLDIVGAGILAIPDIPTIHRFFFSGMVRSAVENLKLDQIQKKSILIEPGVDVEALTPLFSYETLPEDSISDTIEMRMKIKELNPSTEGFFELRRVFSERTNNSIWNRVFAFAVVEDEAGEWITYVLYVCDGEVEVQIRPPFIGTFNMIENKLRQSDARFRRMGLTLLIAGFFSQGLSLAV